VEADKARWGGGVKNRAKSREWAMYTTRYTHTHTHKTRKSGSLSENLTGVKRHDDFPRDLLCTAALSPV